jgi:predicted RNA-binding protein
MPDKPRYWLWSSTQENWEIVKSKGVWATYNRKTTQIVSRGDRFIFYVKGTGEIQGLFEVSSDWFETKDLTWADELRENRLKYPYQIKIAPLVLGRAKYAALVPDLSFVQKKYAPQMYIYGTGGGPVNYREPLTEEDYMLIKSALEKGRKASVVEICEESCQSKGAEMVSTPEKPEKVSKEAALLISEVNEIVTGALGDREEARALAIGCANGMNAAIGSGRVAGSGRSEQETRTIDLTAFLLSCYDKDGLRTIAEKMELSDSGGREILASRIARGVEKWLPEQKIGDLMNRLIDNASRRRMEEIAALCGLPITGVDSDLFLRLVHRIPDLESRVKGWSTPLTLRSMLWRCYDKQALMKIAKKMELSSAGPCHRLVERIARGFELWIEPGKKKELVKLLRKKAGAKGMRRICSEAGLPAKGSRGALFDTLCSRVPELN